jgi:hypothetical protein
LEGARKLSGRKKNSVGRGPQVVDQKEQPVGSEPATDRSRLKRCWGGGCNPEVGSETVFGAGIRAEAALSPLSVSVVSHSKQLKLYSRREASIRSVSYPAVGLPPHHPVLERGVGDRRIQRPGRRAIP